MGTNKPSNIDYDLVAEMHELLEGGEALDQYVQDARSEGDQEIAQAFESIRDQNRENAEKLAKEILANAEEQAKRMHAEAQEKLAEQIQRRGELAERRIATAEAQAAAEVKAAAAELAAQVAEAVLTGQLAGAKKDPLVDKAIEQLGERLQ